jgi:hypothetical protein
MMQVAFDLQTTERAMAAWAMIERMPVLVVGRRGSVLCLRGTEAEVKDALERMQRRYIHFPSLTVSLQVQYERSLETEIV